MYRGYDHIVWVHHFVEVNCCDLRQQFVGIEFRQTVVFVNPVHEFGKGDAHGVIQRTISVI